MRNLRLIALYVFFFVPILLCGQSSVMSFNIRYDNSGDLENRWDNRKAEIIAMIEHYEPTVMGIQEGLHHQVNYLNLQLKDYDYIGIGRDDGNKKGEYTAIFYNTIELQLLWNKTYWLSETPEKVSVGWDASMERIVTCGKFVDKTSRDTFYVFNAHYDHIGEKARESSSQLILKILEELNALSYPVIVMGDLNCEPGDRPIQILKSKVNDSYETSERKSYGPVGTFNHFDTERIMEKRIDYIFTINLWVKEHVHIDDRRKNNMFLSDHLPIFVRFSF